MVVISGIDPLSSAYETATHPSTSYHLGCLMGFEPTYIGITIRGLDRLTTSTVELGAPNW